jgi:hypothetical protein
MLRDPAIKKIFDEIVNQKQPAVFWRVKTEVIVPNVLRREVQNTDHVITMSDFVESVGEYRTIGLQMSPVFYKRYIAPYKDNIQLVVSYSLVTEGGTVLPNMPNYSRIYDAHLDAPVDIDMMSTIGQKEEEKTLDSGNLITINFQLILPILNEMRVYEVGGIYHGTNIENLLLGLFSYGLQDNTDTERLKDFNFPSVRGVEVVGDLNPKVYNRLVIPLSMRLTKLARFLQQEYGIYAAGCNSFFQEGCWYIYPLYDTHRFDNATHKITFIMIPPDEGVSLERSFKREGEHIIVLATGDVKTTDNSEVVAANVGNAIKFNKASDIENNLVSVSNNKAVGNGETNNRVIGVENRKREVNNVRYTDKMFTDNPYKELSKVAASQGQLVEVNWEFSAPDFIRPGMPCRVIYQNKDKLVTRDGVIHGYRDQFSSVTGRITDTTFVHNTKCVLFLDKINK